MAHQAPSKIVTDAVAACAAYHVAITPRQVETWIAKRYVLRPKPPLSDDLVYYLMDLSAVVRPGRNKKTGVLAAMAYRGHHEMIPEQRLRDDILAVMGWNDAQPSGSDAIEAARDLVGKARTRDNPRAMAAIQHVRDAAAQRPHVDGQHPRKASRRRAISKAVTGDPSLGYLALAMDICHPEPESTEVKVVADGMLVHGGSTPQNAETVLRTAHGLAGIDSGRDIGDEQMGRLTRKLSTLDGEKIRVAIQTAPIPSIVRNARLMYPWLSITHTLMGNMADEPEVQQLSMMWGAALATFLTELELHQLESITQSLHERSQTD
ncbi:hypothetical protein [Frankia sp. AvcI1]|uniref:hypothetical protein n=1 Tax=Frankia sp. AvcI1 TaxID=573496 RepID=UPI002118D61D|nr:hypothetical protein [Frankia sp. AvcI1]